MSKIYKRITVYSDLVYCKRNYYQRDSPLTLMWEKGKWYKRSFVKDHIATKDGIFRTKSWIFETENPHLKLNVKDLKKTMKESFYTKTQLRAAKLKRIDEFRLLEK